MKQALLKSVRQAVIGCLPVRFRTAASVHDHGRRAAGSGSSSVCFASRDQLCALSIHVLHHRRVAHLVTRPSYHPIKRLRLTATCKLPRACIAPASQSFRENPIPSARSSSTSRSSSCGNAEQQAVISTHVHAAETPRHWALHAQRKTGQELARSW